MTRVLMASNDQTFSPALTHAYHARGLDVTAGVPNLDPAFGRFDVLHVHWPEELAGWSARDKARTDKVLELLDWWKQRAVIVATVHNLVPHRAERLDGPESVYFNAFYERVDLLCHFSGYSRERYAEQYPAIPQARQIVQPLNTYDHLLPLMRGREAARAQFGVKPDEHVFAVCGAMRLPAEMNLVRAAWSRLRDPSARLLLASGPSWSGLDPVRRTAGKVAHRLWLRDRRISRLGGQVDDSTLVGILEAADTIIIPRLGHHLNSGLVPLALTFGTGILAADLGANREIVPQPQNELYEAGNADSLIEAMRRQMVKSSAEVRAANLAHRDTIGWGAALDMIWPRVVEIGRHKRLPAFTSAAQGEAAGL
ncbi:hypothetical protein [Sphingobium sp. SYK-6]|uniref:hypothetical protein n=1 Tax=Sphingobium sp. (strain NBRC 103272 / SYK-6) TaxID=627192 RepID=UPI0002F844E4|nr:hypothetical protein [Sphingobium sp. SYK-6]